MTKYILQIFILFLLVIEALPTVSQENVRRKFTINGHEFISTSAVENANIETALSAKLSVGSTGQLVTEGIVIGDKEFLSFTGSLFYAGSMVSYKQKVNDWFGLYFKMQFVSRLGSELPTILLDGINTASGSLIGWYFKLYEHKKGYLSGTMSTQRYSGSIINIYKFVQDVINEVPDARIKDKVPVSKFAARLNYAHAFNKTWGMQFDATLGYGEELNQIEKSFTTDLGVFAEANLYAEKKIPLGFGLGYNLSSMPEMIYLEGEFVNILYFNMAYTKASDFELGAEIQYFEAPSTTYKSTPKVITASLNMRFNF